jgi:transposase
LYVNKSITVRLPETEPGVYAQADFGRLGKLWDNIKKRERTAWAFIVTLSYSRHMHVYVTFSQDSTALIEGCEAAWAYFGGIAAVLIVDNMSPAVSIPDKYNPRINKTFMEYAQARGFIVDPTNPAHPRGKVYASYCTSPLRLNF